MQNVKIFKSRWRFNSKDRFCLIELRNAGFPEPIKCWGSSCKKVKLIKFMCNAYQEGVSPAVLRTCEIHGNDLVVIDGVN